jgi:hypothetical protein
MAYAPSWPLSASTPCLPVPLGVARSFSAGAYCPPVPLQRPTPPLKDAPQQSLSCIVQLRAVVSTREQMTVTIGRHRD